MMKERLYIDSTCFIDDVKVSIGKNKHDNDDVWFCKKLFEAHRDGKVQIFTATLTVAECQHVGGNYDKEVQKRFKSLLTSGQFVHLVQDTVMVADTARNLRWSHDLAFGGADSVHIASALEMECSEFLTQDRDFLDKKEDLRKLKIRAIKPHETSLLPSEYLQGELYKDQK